VQSRRLLTLDRRPEAGAGIGGTIELSDWSSSSSSSSSESLVSNWRMRWAEARSTRVSIEFDLVTWGRRGFLFGWWLGWLRVFGERQEKTQRNRRQP
jgi:hypothetical protein